MLRSVLLAAGLVATPAFARNLPPRPEPTIAVTLSERTRPATIAAQTARPVLAADQLDAVLGAPIGPLDPAVVSRLETTLPTVSGDEQLRIAYELAIEYDRHARHWRASGASLQLVADREPDRSRKATLSRDANVAANKAKDFLLKGVKTFRMVTERTPLPVYGDDALFRYGYLLESFKYMKEARTAFDSLLKNFPNSRHVASAHLAFAEYYFEANQLADAEARYKHVLKFPRSLRKFHHHAQAAPIYASLLTTHPNAAFSEAAAVLAIDSLVLVQKLDDMLLLADKLAADQRFLADKPELTGVVKYVRSRSMRR